MKILYISTRIDGLGGLQRTMSVRLNYLVQNGYEVHLLTTNSENKAIHFPLDKRINHIEKQNVSGFFTYKKLIRNTFNEINPDLVVVSDNGLKGFLIPYFLPKKTKIIYELHATKSLITKESNLLFRKLGITKFLIDSASKKFDSFVFLSEKESQIWNLKNSVIIPNPITISTDKQSSLNNKKVIFAGRLTLLKGVDFLLEIWTKINQKHSDWILEIYGEQFPEFDVQKAINEKGLKDSVFVFEPTSEIHKKYSDSSLFLMTSRTETFGLVLTEAMFCGLPCVSFDTPTGPSSIIENGKNGFLISCFDSDLFAEKVNLLIENKNLRKQMGQNAKKSTQKFELESVMKKWKELFEGTNMK